MMVPVVHADPELDELGGGWWKQELVFSSMLLRSFVKRIRVQLQTFNHPAP